LAQVHMDAMGSLPRSIFDVWLNELNGKQARR